MLKPTPSSRDRRRRLSDHITVTTGRRGLTDWITDLAGRVTVTEQGCWTIPGLVDAQVVMGGHRERVHRLIYANFVAPIPDGASVRRTCGTSSCINPEHLTAT